MSALTQAERRMALVPLEMRNDGRSQTMFTFRSYMMCCVNGQWSIHIYVHARRENIIEANSWERVRLD